MAAYSSNSAWEIPWSEEHGGLQSRGLQSVTHDWTRTRTHKCIWISLLYTRNEYNIINQQYFNKNLKINFQWEDALRGPFSMHEISVIVGNG